MIEPLRLGGVSAEEHAVARPAARGRAQVSLPGARRAVVIGAGSFGTAVAVLLARAALRTTLQTRTEEQAAELGERRVNERYLPGVELPSQLRVESVASGRGARRLRLPRRPLDEHRRRDRAARRSRARPPRGRGLAVEGARDARAAPRPPRCCARASAPPASRASAAPRTRRRPSTRARGSSPRPSTRRSRRRSPRSSRAPGSSASSPTTRSASSSRASRRTRPRSRRARRRGRASTPRARRRVTSSPRSGASPRRAGRARSPSSASPAPATSSPPRSRR